MSAKAANKVDQFLAGPIAGRIAFPGRVVIRRGEMNLAGFRGMAAQGEVTIEGKPLCELELGGQIIATGKIEEKDGDYYFVAQEESNE
jgi:hypothetical protein